MISRFTSQQDKEHEENILKIVEERLGDKQRAVEAREKRVVEQYNRMAECRDLITAALTDAGYMKLAAHIYFRINGIYAEKAND